MDPFVDGNLDWSALALDDLEELVELYTVIAYFDDPVQGLEVDELADHFSAPCGEPSRNAVVGRDSAGTIVACGWNVVRATQPGTPEIWLAGGVHPSWRHKGIGARLMGWQVARAREWLVEVHAEHPEVDRVRLCCHVEARGRSQQVLMAAQGFEPRRWFFDLQLAFGPEPERFVLPQAPVVEGVDLVPYHPRLAEAVREAHNLAFADRVGHREVSRQEWEDSVARPGARPEWSWVALVDGRVVGHAMNCLVGEGSEALGWTDRIAVLPSWRGRGLGTALLACSIHTFHQAGLAGAGVGVDPEEPDEALGLFTRNGYRQQEAVIAFERELLLVDAKD